MITLILGDRDQSKRTKTFRRQEPEALSDSSARSIAFRANAFEHIMPLRLLIALLPTLVSGCAVFAVADVAVTVVATTVKIGATVVETTVDVAAAGVNAALGSDENEEKNE